MHSLSDLNTEEGNAATLRTTDISKDGHIEYSSMPLANLDLSKIRQHILHENDLVITRSGRIGTVAVFKGFRLPVIPGAFLIRFRLKKEIADPRFYRYFFNSPAGQKILLSVATGSVQQNLNITSLHRLYIPVPSLIEQRAIAYILGTMDRKIELNNRINENLDAIVRSIFKSWFVDFDPVRAKSEGHEPARMDAKTAMLFPDNLDESSIGEIPHGWKAQPIGEMVRVLGGGTPSTMELAYWEGGTHPFCTPKDMSSLKSPVLLYTERYLSNQGVARISSGQLPVGTVLLSSRAPIGYLAISEVRVSINQGIIGMICDRQLSGLYVLYWLQANMDRIIANANGSTFPEISKQSFRPINILVPPTRILERFQLIIEPLYRQLVSNTRQSQALIEIRDALIPRLLSGEIQVPRREE
ncbi:MAG: restriction endonuclease subunit S [Methanothrix sp.]